MNIKPQDLFSTYSIVARDPDTEQLGIAVQTHQMCVGAAVPWLKAGVGAIATQAMTNVSFGPQGLELLSIGMPPSDVVDALISGDDGAHNRQLAIVDAKGHVAAWTGDNCIPFAEHHIGEDYSVQANMMASDSVIHSMTDAFENTEGDFAERMMSALLAAQREGGDIRGMQSAALKIVRSKTESDDPTATQRALYDLRVDEHHKPLTELTRLVRLRRGSLLSFEGHETSKKNQALKLWGKARTMAPELEEMSFWQAVSLADEKADIPNAVLILSPMLEVDDRREHWIDLIRRIESCGIIQRKGTAEELIAALGDH
jgi:uncharacterized Ntn-hydrolase superfamily protein